MLSSLQALQIVLEYYPSFAVASDHFYEPEEEVLLCIEMYTFAEYLWNLSTTDVSQDLIYLKELLSRLLVEGNSQVKYAIKACLIDHLDTLDSKTNDPIATERWLASLSEILCENSLSWRQKHKDEMFK